MCNGVAQKQGVTSYSRNELLKYKNFLLNEDDLKNQILELDIRKRTKRGKRLVLNENAETQNNHYTK